MDVRPGAVRADVWGTGGRGGGGKAPDAGGAADPGRPPLLYPARPAGGARRGLLEGKCFGRIGE